jgi:hypothetical protein
MKQTMDELELKTMVKAVMLATDTDYKDWAISVTREIPDENYWTADDVLTAKRACSYFSTRGMEKLPDVIAMGSAKAPCHLQISRL